MAQRPDDYYDPCTQCPNPKGAHQERELHHKFEPAQRATLEDVVDNYGS